MSAIFRLLIQGKGDCQSFSRDSIHFGAKEPARKKFYLSAAFFLAKISLSCNQGYLPSRPKEPELRVSLGIVHELLRE